MTRGAVQTGVTQLWNDKILNRNSHRNLAEDGGDLQVVISIGIGVLAFTIMFLIMVVALILLIKYVPKNILLKAITLIKGNKVGDEPPQLEIQNDTIINNNERSIVDPQIQPTQQQVDGQIMLKKLKTAFIEKLSVIKPENSDSSDYGMDIENRSTKINANMVNGPDK